MIAFARYGLLAAALVAGAAAAQSPLLEANGCSGCHAPDRQLVGPPWRDIAAKYRGDAKAPVALAAKLRSGNGHPIKVSASEADLQAMVKAVLGASAAATPPAATAAISEGNPGNQVCLACHGQEGFSPHVDAKQLAASVHAPRACVDCHRDITAIPHEPRAREARQLTIIREGCGGCHVENFRSYGDTYHGQVTRLGYTYTAKCFDCHGKHDIKRIADSASTVHPNNRVETCRKCHSGATAGFAAFQPHANTHDFKRYPYTWIASKFMIGLLAGTFGFFWLHAALWFYRENKERRQGTPRPHVRASALPADEGKEVRRFSVWWRLAHLVFAVTLMILTLTGMAVWYADSAWAPYVIRALGGPKSAAMIHRVCAALFAAVFLAHLVYLAIHLGRKWRTFNWLGPDSLIPWIPDLKDALAMFRWFFGRGPRPPLERWTYWEKFDYWAPFWGVTIIGASGFMMWFPNLTASVLPGWAFNVAQIAHGEEAFLAAVFLFTVHFFNNHFRPNKFPLDVVMFTGSMPLEDFRREHRLHYERLLASGELERHLVQAPSPPIALGARILGFTLIAVGLALLALVLTGFVSSLGR